ncbi:MAG: NAD(P)/FAD-dependent oxidoreductase [bacterium]|nr:NAD(P)/FAD-dependent oxidoreductase [bacterium]
MAAGRAAERGLKVILLEKNDSLGKKLLITGGGRCNVTNAEFDDRVLLAKFKDNDKFLFSAFSQYSVKEALDFFNSRKMETKVEAEKRVFPTSNSAQSVWNVLHDYLKASNVTIRSKAEVVGFIEDNTVKPKQIKSVQLKNGEQIFAKSFVLATGGKSRPETGSTGEGFDWLKQIGHTVVESDAALVPVKIKDAWVKQLQGVTLPSVKITLFQNETKQLVKKGKILFTHFGVSGPTILNMSKDIGELLKYDDVFISLDILPDHDYSTLNDALQELFKKENKKKFKNSLGSLVPSSLVSIIIEKSGINPDTFCNSVTRDERLTLVKVLKDIRMQPIGLLGVEKAIVTSGGVLLTEVDFKTMQSKLVSNLYVVGDVLNIDRPSGGYSLQLCWTTGFVAGNQVETNK